MSERIDFRYSYRAYHAGAACPVCYGKEALLLHQVNSREAAQHFVLLESDRKRCLELASHIERLWRAPVCVILQCAQCSFCFSFPFVAGDQRFYDLAYERTGYPPDKWEYEITFDFLGKTIGRQSMKDLRLIEIGAGDGSFVKRISPEPIKKENILATEFSDYGVSEIRKYGVNCIDIDFRELRGDGYHEKFDVICLFQVLEHLDDLDGLFSQFTFLARRGAFLFLSVPSDKQIAYNELNGALLDMPPNHIGRWNRKCFPILGQRHGWKMLDHRYEVERFLSMSRRFLVYKYLRMSQFSGTIANRIRRVRSRSFRRLLEVGFLGVSAPFLSPHLYSMKKQGIGDSQWVCFRREV